MNRTDPKEHLHDRNAEEFAAMLGRRARQDEEPAGAAPVAPTAPASIVVREGDTPDVRDAAVQFAEMMGSLLGR